MKGMHKGHHGQENGHGQQAFADMATPSVAPTVTDEVIASLRFMIEEEKMAGDLYEAFYAQTGQETFSRIAESEDRHMDALLKQADKLGIQVDDLIALPAGEYSDPALQTMYEDLLATGSLSVDAAFTVGQQAELADIADLSEALLGLSDSGLVGVYTNLLAGSENHLAAFEYALSI